MSDQWYLLQEGQQYGPYSGDQLLEFAREGRIVRESMLWTEELPEWVTAAQVEGLFLPEPTGLHPVGGPVKPGPKPRLAGWSRGGGGGPGGGKPGHFIPTAGRPVVAPQQAAVAAMAAIGGGTYPVVAAKSANFGMVAGLLGGGLAATLVGAAVVVSATLHHEQLQGQQAVLAAVLLGFGVIALLTGKVVSLVYLARLWSLLRYGNPRTTPGMAVGLLFVPLFNLYWIFVAFYGLAQEWNRITHQCADLKRAPRMTEGMFLTYCIGILVFAPLALVMWFPVMSQICRSINVMAIRAMRRRAGGQPA